MTFARDIWMRVETLHAVTYFGEETVEAGRRLGCSGFWMSYFGFRAAPMGRVEAAVVDATFFNFAPSFVARWVPEVWQRAEPRSFLAARADAGAATLRRLVPGVERVAVVVNPALARAAASGVRAGRPLFAANAALACTDDPVAALWQWCTTLREHRGDGHVAALTAAGLDGLEAHVLIALEQERDPTDLQRARGWNTDDWAAARQRCAARGFVDAGGVLTGAGQALRQDVERTTDDLAAVPWAAVDGDERRSLLLRLDSVATAVSRSGLIRYPNPIGLPPLG